MRLELVLILGCTFPINFVLARSCCCIPCTCDCTTQIGQLSLDKSVRHGDDARSALFEKYYGEAEGYGVKGDYDDDDENDGDDENDNDDNGDEQGNEGNDDDETETDDTETDETETDEADVNETSKPAAPSKKKKKPGVSGGSAPESLSFTVFNGSIPGSHSLNLEMYLQFNPSESGSNGSYIQGNKGQSGGTYQQQWEYESQHNSLGWYQPSRPDRPVRPGRPVRPVRPIRPIRPGRRPPRWNRFWSEWDEWYEW